MLFSFFGQSKFRHAITLTDRRARGEEVKVIIHVSCHNTFLLNILLSQFDVTEHIGHIRMYTGAMQTHKGLHTRTHTNTSNNSGKSHLLKKKLLLITILQFIR